MLYETSSLIFLSTLSLRRATRRFLASWSAVLTISIHALLAESDLVDMAFCSVAICISIHALLAESDGGVCAMIYNTRSISIHALLAESDARHYTYKRFNALFLSTLSLRRATSAHCKAVQRLEFLSTLSLRRATAGIALKHSKIKYFYPRSPCGERQQKCTKQ